MILDLTNLSQYQLKLMNKISVEIQEEFNLLTYKILQRVDGNDISWLVSNIISRHTYQNDLFTDCTYLVFIRNIVDGNNLIDQIIVPNKVLKEIIKSNFPNISVVSKRDKSNRFLTASKNRLNQLADIIRIVHFTFTSLLSRNKYRKKDIPKDKALILLDTFLLQQSIKKGKYIDRYYTGILDYLDDKQKELLHFVPTIIGKFDRVKLKRIYKNSIENILYKTDFLKLKDYIKSLQMLNKHKLDCKGFDFCGIDISRLISNIFKKNKYSLISFRAILNYFFVKRLKEYGIRVNLFIDWNENQPIDKGLIKGFRDFYPDVYIKGYQGFIVSTDFNFYVLPTGYEINNGVIPDEIIVVGNTLQERIKKFTSNIRVNTGPAFRFLYKKNFNSNKKSKKNILLISPIGIENSINLFVTVIKGISSVRNYKLYIKLHPSISISIFRKKVQDMWQDNFYITNANLGSLLDYIDVVLGHTTSALMESLLYAVPVLVVANRYGITQNPIPNEVDNRIWKLCYSTKEITEGIEYYLFLSNDERSKFIKIANKIKEEYFESVTKEKVNEFLNLNMQ